MAFLRAIEAPSADPIFPHYSCDIPKFHKVGIGTIWQCDVCERIWLRTNIQNFVNPWTEITKSMAEELIKTERHAFVL